MRDMSIVKSKNGALRDTETGHFVQGGVVTTAIASPSQAREMVARKMEIKQARLMAGANRFVAKGGEYDGTDLDFVEVIGEVQMAIAANPMNGSDATRAAQFLVNEAGIGEKQAQAQGAGDSVGVLRAIVGELAVFAAALRGEGVMPAPGTAQDEEQV